MNLLQKMVALLQQRIGLDANSLGPDTVERALRQRMKEREVTEEEQYWNLAQISRTEFDLLLEELVVSETWFFRDEEPFRALVEFATGVWRKENPRQRWRVLSAPCATGEEPYSLAMALLEAGWSPADFRIDAMDLSRRALQQAERGLYPQLSFRGQNLSFRDRHFIQISPFTYQLRDPVRASVRFYQRNLLDPKALADRPLYDVIFCRNLLIYLNDAARSQVFAQLELALATQGILLVGHAETSQVPDRHFRQILAPRAYAFIKCPPPLKTAVVNVQTIASLEKRNRGRPGADIFVHDRPALSEERPEASACSELQREPGNLIRRAKQFADVGQLQEAVDSCRAYLREHRPTPEVLFLLGTVRGAQGADAEAEQLLNQVVYLNSQHIEAMARLSVLAAKRNDARGAASWQLRIRRVQARLLRGPRETIVSRSEGI